MDEYTIDYWSEPHINGLSGAGCYGVSYVHRSYVNFGLRGAGDQIHLRLSTLQALYGLGRNGCHSQTFQFKISLQSASNDHIEQNDSSSPILPTINDIRCKIGNTSNYYSCTVYVLQFQDTLKEAG